MSKKNIVYLDTNIILRFLIGDGGELADKISLYVAIWDRLK